MNEELNMSYYHCRGTDSRSYNITVVKNKNGGFDGIVGVGTPVDDNVVIASTLQNLAVSHLDSEDAAFNAAKERLEELVGDAIRGQEWKKKTDDKLQRNIP